MRLLLLHTDEAILSFLPALLEARGFTVEIRDGNDLDHSTLASLIKSHFDCIIVNLRLPAMLSLRIAEVIHLARVPTRLILMSGAPQDLGSGISLYDGYIRIPFFEKGALHESIERPLMGEYRSIRSQEHIDVAILNLLQRCDGLVPGCRGALHAFGMYRDAYLHRPWTAPQHDFVLTPAESNKLVDFLAEVEPLGFSGRLDRVSARVHASQLYTPAQRSFLSAQFDHLLDAFGLTLMDFRKETAEVMEGLERFGCLAEARGADVDSAGLRESLLRASAPMRYMHQGITQIVRLLSGAG